VQEDQLFALDATGNRCTVDQLEPQVGIGLQQLGDLARVGLEAPHRLVLARPVADYVVGQNVLASDGVRRGPERRPHLRAESRAFLNVGHRFLLRCGAPAERGTASLSSGVRRLNYPRGHAEGEHVSE